MTELPQQIVDGPAGLSDCCDHLATCSVFGFDTEFIGEETFHPRLCLVQVATDERLFVIDPLAAGPLDSFWQLVADPAHVVVVHAGREEIRMCRHGCGRPPGNLFDLQVAAGSGRTRLSDGARRVGVSIAQGAAFEGGNAHRLGTSAADRAADSICL